MAWFPELRPIGTQEPVPPWLLYATLFEVDSKLLQLRTVPGFLQALLQGPLVVVPSKSECTCTFSSTVQNCSSCSAVARLYKRCNAQHPPTPGC